MCTALYNIRPGHFSEFREFVLSNYLLGANIVSLLDSNDLKQYTL